MNIRKMSSVIILCVVAITATAQSFESLKRSKGKSALYTTVEKVLSGQISASAAASEVSTSTALTEPYNGKTPIYLVLDYLAHTPKDQCQEAEKLLEAFFANKSFDVNLRYSSLMPPFAYLIRENYDYLNGKFSSNYISDNVIKRFIEVGASVNTYNSDGSSLMAFASSTRNKFLQDYFLNQGIDLGHRDKAGNDEAYHIINDGNTELLKRLIDEGRIKVEFTKLRNKQEDIAKHPAMYNYLAEVFAQQVNTYDEIKSFRAKFSQRKQLVEQKYQKLAQDDIDKIKTFYDVIAIERKFPDLQFIENAKKDYYAKACQDIDNFYEKAKEAAHKNQIYTSPESRINSLIRELGDNHYDPSGKLPKAREMNNYFYVANALEFSPSYSYINYGKAPAPEDDDPGEAPTFNDRGDPRYISRAISTCMQLKGDFESFKSYAEPRLRDIQENLISKLNRDERTYLNQLEKYRQQLTMVREALLAKLERMTMNEVLANIKYISSEWSKWRVFDSDDNFTDHKECTFKGWDNINFRVYWRFNRGYDNYYFVDKEKFSTPEAAIVDAYKRRKAKIIERRYSY